MQLFNHAVAKNINIRFIIIISVLPVVAPICNYIIIIMFLPSLVLTNFQGFFSVCACILFDYGMLKKSVGEFIICPQSSCIS